MPRAQRLLDLIQLLRNHRFPVTGAYLAETLGISLRTLYRDIATLQEHGASIEGEPGLGYVLRLGFVLPPLMFTVDEIEALVLGSRWVAKRADDRLSAAANAALMKIAGVLPDNLRHTLDTTALLVGPNTSLLSNPVDLSVIRQAIRTEHKVEIVYRDANDAESARTIWPFALGFFDHVRVLVAWCELRQGFRHFRTDRLVSFAVQERRYPQRRHVLLKMWREIELLRRREYTADKN